MHPARALETPSEVSRGMQGGERLHRGLLRVRPLLAAGQEGSQVSHLQDHKPQGRLDPTKGGVSTTWAAPKDQAERRCQGAHPSGVPRHCCLVHGGPQGPRHEARIQGPHCAGVAQLATPHQSPGSWAGQ